MRKTPLVNSQYYHVFNRSIAKYEIFNNKDDYLRIIELLSVYRFSELPYKYSKLMRLDLIHRKAIMNDILKTNNMLVEIIAYCIMPTHLHLILKQLTDGGISKYMGKVLDSSSRYFNIKHKRKGPLWEGRFKSILVLTDEQMLHLTRYIHLNPVSANLIKKPDDWLFSSYLEYLGKVEDGICQFNDIMTIDPKTYQKFVLDRMAYQRELSKIKHLLFENYIG